MANAPAALSSVSADSDGPILKMTGITKRFPGVRALENAHLEIGADEIHALLGENGAGKSTLLKILSGAHAADAGTIELFGEPVSFASPHDAQRAGIVTIYQEFTLAPDMTIAENVFIGREPGSRLFVSWRRLAEDTRAITDKIGLKRDPMTQVRDLSVAEQQLVEIARALAMRSKPIVRDEPTSALSEAEVANPARIIRTLKAEGLSIIFVTHRLEEVFRLCDRYTVLRDGHYVASGRVADTNVDAIIRMMVGRDVGALYGERPIPEHGKVALEIEGLTRRRNARDPNAIELIGISLKAHHGEILGLAGLVGAGRTETARAIFGADAFDHGAIRVDGAEVRFSSPRDAMSHGIGLVPEDRKKQALFLSLAIRTNITIAAQDEVSRGWFIDEKKEGVLIDEFRKLLSIRMASPEQAAGQLSGGNQQKIVLARWLALRPRILIVDEPTRGIDIGSKVEVHNLLIDMAKQGIAVIVISSELPEILAVSDRIVTMREGRVTGEIARTKARLEAAEDKGVDVFGFVARFAPTLFLIVLMLLFAIIEPRFLSSINLFNVMRQISITGLLAIGMTFVILTAGIDLSIGSLLAFAGLVAAAVEKGGLENRFTVGEGGVGYGWGAAALAAIAVGIAGGYLQGLAITRLKVPPFVVTLGGMSAFRGAALLFAAGGPISGFQPSFTWWGQGKIGPVPIPVIIFLAAAGLAHITLRYTRYGRQVYAVGGNPEAARLSGLNVNRVIASVYVIMGFFAGLGSFVLAARLNSAEAVAGTGYELTVIASILIGVLLNGLVLMNVSSYIQQIVIGVIIVLAVAFDTFAKSRRRRI